MADSSSASERFSLVASFYGPGNITAWLCTVASVFVTWCFNAPYRRKDSISIDLIFALVVPGVAAGHVIYMMFFSGDPKHESVRQLFTSSDSKIVRHAAATEAALNVCETFSAAAVTLVFISMFHGHLKRTLAVVIVGLLAFSTEAVVFVQARGVGVSTSNLTRPFLFNFFGVMASILVFLVVWVSAFSMILGLRFRTVDNPEEQTELESANLQLEADIRIALGNHVGDKDATAKWESPRHDVKTLHLAEAETREGESMKFLTLSSVFFLPLAYLATVGSSTGMFGSTSFMSPLAGMLASHSSFHRAQLALWS